MNLTKSAILYDELPVLQTLKVDLQDDTLFVNVE